jgi:cellulose synthase/poly-beta-1,6-N-acetylglucosamine synthase-like glycosyltransferase/transposase-like protein
MKNTAVTKKEAIIKVLKEGKSVAEVAREYQISRKTVYSWIKLYNSAHGKGKNLALKNKYRKAETHPKAKLFRIRHRLIQLVIAHPEWGVRQYSSEVGVNYNSIYKLLVTLGASTPNLRHNFKRNYQGPGRLASDVRLEIVRKAQDFKASVTTLSKQYGVARKTIYKWIKSYQIDPKLTDSYAKAEAHPKALYPKLTARVLEIVAESPHLSVHKIAELVPASSWTVWSILDRKGLNTASARAFYADREAAEKITPITASTRTDTVFESFTPNTAPAPPPNRLLNFFKYFAASFTTTSILSIGIVFWYKLLFAASTGPAQTIGYLFATLSLVMGSIFLLYSLKYYLTLAIVLSYSQDNPEKKSAYKKRSLLNLILGGKDEEENYSPNNSSVGLEADLSYIKFDRKPYISVHIPFYNEKNVVERAIRAATSFKYGGEYEVILCDDSTDETTQIIRQYQKDCLFKGEALKEIKGDGWSLTEVEVKPGVTLKHLHRTTRSGYKGKALELALSLVNPKTEFVGVFDADFVPYPDSLDLFLRYFKAANNMSENYSASNVAAVQGYQWHVLNKSENWITRGVRSEYSGSYVIERSGAEIYGGLKQISGSVYMIRRDVLEKIGWGTSITEDFELTLRLYNAGLKVVYTPYIQAPAECVSTVKRLVRQRMRWAEGHSFNVKKLFKPLLTNPALSFAEKLEFVYLSPYYLQAFFFLLGTAGWIISETIFRTSLPFWTEVWGWSMVITNLIALPLVNIVGLFVEESEEKDYTGIASFVALSYLLVPFQAYAAVKGLIEKEEGPWFRTPKTGRITDLFSRGKFYRFIQGFLPGIGNGGVNKITPSNTSSPYLSLNTANNRFENSNNYKPHVPRLKFMPKVVMAFVLIVSMLTTNLAPFFGSSAMVEEIGKKLTQSRELNLESVNEDNGQTSPVFELTLDDSIVAKDKSKKTLFSMPFKVNSVSAAEDVKVKLTDFNGELVDADVQLEKKADNKYLVSLPNQKFFTPGKYTLETTVSRNGKKYIAYEDFSWGVLAINATKSVYSPNEEIDLSFGVLDERGKTLCDAGLILTVDIVAEDRQIVLQSKDGSIRKAMDCAINNVGMEPDYFAGFTAGQVDSEYKLTLEALTKNGIKRVEDSIWVRAKAEDYVIERSSFPTRIYPPVTYPVKLTVKANRDYKGEVVDSLPENFEISQITGNGKVGHDTFSLPFKQEGKQTVTWNVDFKKGETYTLEYRIKFPPESPQFYLIGPLKIGDYSEQRSWQVAADVNVQLRHEINILTHTMTGSAVEDSKEVASLSQSLYNGTVTVYFEAVISGAASNTGTVTLRSGSTDYATLTGRTDGTLTRTRSAAFTPAATGTYYNVRNNADGVRSQTIISAKIIVIQNAENITTTQTQIEIGSYETGKTNTTASALNSPKYWKYTAANWDGTVSMSASSAFLKTDNEASAPTFVSAGSIIADTTGGGSVTPTMPSHLADDILIVSAQNTGGDTPVTSTTGWQTIATVTGTSDARWFWKRATGAGTAGPTITTSNTDLFAIGYVIRGAITTGTPFEATKTAGDNTTASTTPTTSSLTTLGGNRLVITFVNHDDDTTFSSGNPPSGWTADSNVTSASGTQVGFNVISKTQASAGVVSQATVGTLAASELWASTTFAFKPNTDLTPGVTIKLQEDDGSFGSWSDKATIMNNVSTSGSRVIQTVNFTPTDGRSYRLVSSISNGTGHSYDIYIAKIIINQTATAEAGVSYDTSTSSTSNSITALSWSHTAASNASHIAVGVTSFNTPTSVTYGGQNLTLVTQTGTGSPTLTFWVLQSPPTGANNVQVNFSVASEVVAGAVTLIGATGYRNLAGNFDDVGDQTTSSVSPNSSNNEMAVSFLGLFPTSFSIDAAGTNQTERLSNVSSNFAITASTQPSTGSLTSTWNWTGGASYTHLVVGFFKGAITKLEPQYLLLNTASTTTGSALNYQTLWDSSEWGGVSNTYYYAQDARGAGANSKLIDRDNANATVTNSSVTGANQQISSALTMPTTGHNLDTQIDNAGTAVDATRILVKVSVDVVPENPFMLLILAPMLGYAIIWLRRRNYMVV